MKLTKLTLIRGKSTCFLQGMVHSAPARFLEKVDTDLARAVRTGSIIFTEGLSDVPELRKGAHPAEYLIRDCVEDMEGFLEDRSAIARQHGLERQGKVEVDPPGTVVHADCSYAAYVFKLYEAGFHKTLGCRLFKLSHGGFEELAEKEPRVDDEALLPDVRERRRKYLESVFRKESRLRKIWEYLLYGPLKRITVTWRSELASNAINLHLPSRENRTGYSQYGEMHIEEIAVFLGKRGWRVAERSYDNLMHYLE